MKSKTYKSKNPISEFEIEVCLDCDELGIDESHICHPAKFLKRLQERDKKLATAIENKFPRERIMEMIKEILRERIKQAERILEKSFEEYDKLFSKGISFKERVGKIDMERVEQAKVYISNFANKAKYLKVKPLTSWIRESDYGLIKQIGFKSFLNKFFELAYE